MPFYHSKVDLLQSFRRKLVRCLLHVLVDMTQKAGSINFLAPLVQGEAHDTGLPSSLRLDPM